jgi:ABC-type dipeptide/oligopeptide/nickel transport system permease component
MKTYLTYGFAMAFAGAALAVLLYLLGYHSDPAKLRAAQGIGMAGGLAIGVTCIVLGTKARRAEIPASEEFGYGRAFGAGFMIALFASLFGIITTFVYAKFINPEFVDVIVQAQVQQLEAKGLSADKIQGAEKVIRTMASPYVQACFSFIAGLVMGTIISLITAAFLKRPAAPFAAETPPSLA